MGRRVVIAGIDISVEVDENIASLFALWRLSQLIIGFVLLIVYLRYKSLDHSCICS